MTDIKECAELVKEAWCLAKEIDETNALSIVKLILDQFNLNAKPKRKSPSKKKEPVVKVSVEPIVPPKEPVNVVAKKEPVIEETVTVEFGDGDSTCVASSDDFDVIDDDVPTFDVFKAKVKELFVIDKALAKSIVRESSGVTKPIDVDEANRQEIMNKIDAELEAMNGNT